MTAQVPATGSAPRRSPLRFINIALVLFALVFVPWTVVHSWHRIVFRLTGRVTVDGATFYLQPGDNYLTRLLINEGHYEPTETALVRDILKEGDTFIDVGANIGWYTVHGSRAVGDQGRVVAFEPDPASLAVLRRNLEANGLQNVVVEEKGLSNAAGSFKLYLNPDNLGMHSLVIEHDGGQHFINVATVRFDDYWQGRGPIRLIKIDTEGAEGMILDGMKETLKQPGLELIVEYAPQRLRQSGYDPDQLLNSLYQLGYRASLIDEPANRVVPLGTPRLVDLKLAGEEPVINLHFKR